MSIINVAEYLTLQAVAEPRRFAIHAPAGTDSAGRRAYVSLSFAELNACTNTLAHTLTARGIRRGTRVALMVPPSIDFFTLAFALFKIAAVPVLIDPGMGVRRLGKCLAEAKPEAFIGIPKAMLARRLLGWARSSLRVTISTRELRDLPTAGPFDMPTVSHDELAAILFTSGSTGPAKGVRYTHGIFAAQVESLRKTYNIEPGETDLTTFPLFALFAPALGMTAVIPRMDATRPAEVDPEAIREAIEHFGVENMFGSPALLNRVGRYGVERAWTFPTVKRVLSAGAPVPAMVLESFAKLLAPDVEIFTPYGATEALPVASIGSSEVLGETRIYSQAGAGTCVGKPVAGMSVRVIPVMDESIPEWSEARCLPSGVIGEFVVSGPVVTASYDARPEATAAAKIYDGPTGRVWHRMGDLGTLDSTGRLWFCGRKAHRVRTPGGPMDTIPVEAIFNGHPLVKRSALVGVPGKGGIVPVVCVEVERTSDDFIRELQALAAEHPHTRAVQTFLTHPGFPVDIRHNAKIFREKLAVWAAKQRACRNLIAPTDPIPASPTIDGLRACGADA